MDIYRPERITEEKWISLSENGGNIMYMECNKQEKRTFKVYLAKLNSIAQTITTQDNFVTIQKVQKDILDSYTEGTLTDSEYRTLYNSTNIIMNEMRKELGMV